jgi:carboxymethylenebutenolidase
MPIHDVDVPTPDGSARATLHMPDGSGPWPAVIMYPDAGSVREALLRMADQLAADGYVVLLPDIYYRSAPYEPFSVDTAFTDPDERQRMGAMSGALTGAVIASDAAALADFLATRPEVRPGGIGTTGYCLGGRMSLIAAGHLGARVSAAASIHGGRLAVEDDPDSPHLLAAGVEAVVYVAGAENDPYFGDDQAERLHEAYRAAGVEHTIDHYAAGHGFAVPDNPTFDEAAAERHRSALSALFASALR